MAVDQDIADMDPNGSKPSGEYNAFAADPHQQLAAPSAQKVSHLPWPDFFPFHHISHQFSPRSKYYHANNYHAWYMNPYNMENYQSTMPGIAAPSPERIKVEEPFSRNEDFPQQPAAASAHGNAQLISASNFYDAQRMEADYSVVANRAPAQPPANAPDHEEIELIPSIEHPDTEGYYEELWRPEAENQWTGPREVADSVGVPVLGPRYAYSWEVPGGSASSTTAGSVFSAGSTTASGSAFDPEVTSGLAFYPWPDQKLYRKRGKLPASDPHPPVAFEFGPPTPTPRNLQPVTAPRPAPASGSVSAASNPQAAPLTKFRDRVGPMTEAKRQLAEQYRRMEQEDEVDEWEEPTAREPINIGNGQIVTLPIRGQGVECKSP